MSNILYPISIVSKQLSLHEQTIREYEKHNLVKPMRKNGRRYFSASDIARISLISTLTQEMGLNLAGVLLVIHLAKNLKMSDDELFDFVVDHKEKLHLGH